MTASRFNFSVNNTKCMYFLILKFSYFFPRSVLPLKFSFTYLFNISIQWTWHCTTKSNCRSFPQKFVKTALSRRYFMVEGIHKLLHVGNESMGTSKQFVIKAYSLVFVCFKLHPTFYLLSKPLSNHNQTSYCCHSKHFQASFFKSCSEDTLLLMTFVLRTLRISALLQLLVVGFFPKFSLPQVSLNNLFVIASARKPVKSGDKTPSFHYFKYDLIQLFHPFHIIKNFHSLWGTYASLQNVIITISSYHRHIFIVMFMLLQHSLFYETINFLRHGCYFSVCIHS